MFQMNPKYFITEIKEISFYNISNTTFIKIFQKIMLLNNQYDNFQKIKDDKKLHCHQIKLENLKFHLSREIYKKIKFIEKYKPYNIWQIKIYPGKALERLLFIEVKDKIKTIFYPIGYDYLHFLYPIYKKKKISVEYFILYIYHKLINIISYTKTQKIVFQIREILIDRKNMNNNHYEKLSKKEMIEKIIQKISSSKKKQEVMDKISSYKNKINFYLEKIIKDIIDKFECLFIKKNLNISQL